MNCLNKEDIIMSIRYLGSFSDSTFTNALEKERANPMLLKDFYYLVNLDTNVGCCSCCKNKKSIYAVFNYLNTISKESVGLCVDCLRILPEELDVVNLYSNGAPPRLHLKNQ